MSLSRLCSLTLHYTVSIQSSSFCSQILIDSWLLCLSSSRKYAMRISYSRRNFFSKIFKNIKKKSLKIPNRKITKDRTTIYKTLHRKPKIEQHEPYALNTRSVLRCSTCGSRRVTLVTPPVINYDG